VKKPFGKAQGKRVYSGVRATLLRSAMQNYGRAGRGTAFEMI